MLQCLSLRARDVELLAVAFLVIEVRLAVLGRIERKTHFVEGIAAHRATAIKNNRAGYVVGCFCGIHRTSRIDGVFGNARSKFEVIDSGGCEQDESDCTLTNRHCVSSAADSL